MHEPTQALVAYGLARRVGMRHVNFFSIFRVNQFRNVPCFAANVAVRSALRNCVVSFTAIGTAYWFQTPERETLQGEAYGKETLAWYLPQLKKFSASNPNAVWAIE